MGTQRSSDGPGSGVPLVPPWVEPVPPTEEPTETKDGEESQSSTEKDADQKLEVTAVAPERRFQTTRLNLGKFARSGGRQDLESGLGHYVRTGLGGGGSAVRRLAGTASAAGKLYGVLDSFRTGEAQTPDLGLDKKALSGKPAREVGDRIIDAVCPIDGTQDTEARRDSISRSISELVEQFPNVDLIALTEEQISLLLERFVAFDLCHRIELDVGKAVFMKAPDPATAVRRIEEMRQYIKEKISASFRKLNKEGKKLTRSGAAGLTAAVIRDTLSVFEDYVR